MPGCVSYLARMSHKNLKEICLEISRPRCAQLPINTCKQYNIYIYIYGDDDDDDGDGDGDGDDGDDDDDDDDDDNDNEKE